MEKTAIVSGVSRGLGKAVAMRLMESGIRVVGISRSAIEDAELLEKIDGGELVHVAGDVTREGIAAKVYEAATDAGEVHYLYNCAGAGVFGPCGGFGRADLDKVFGANLIGLILMTESVVESFKENGGVIVNVMSTAALGAKANEAVYCAAKWGARAYTESLRAECKGTGAKVIAAYPGGMNTDFWASATNSHVDPSGFMNPAEVAEIIVNATLEYETAYVSDLTINRK